MRPDWALPRSWGEWALAEFPHWTASTVRSVAANFRDHWVGKTGKDATKADWEATWRNWCRSDITQRQFGPSRPRPGAHEPASFDKDARDAEAARLLGFELPAKRRAASPADVVEAGTAHTGAAPPALPAPRAASAHPGTNAAPPIAPPIAPLHPATTP